MNCIQSGYGSSWVDLGVCLFTGKLFFKNHFPTLSVTNVSLLCPFLCIIIFPFFSSTGQVFLFSFFPSSFSSFSSLPPSLFPFLPSFSFLLLMSFYILLWLYTLNSIIDSFGILWPIFLWHSFSFWVFILTHLLMVCGMKKSREMLYAFELLHMQECLSLTFSHKQHLGREQKS